MKTSMLVHARNGFLIACGGLLAMLALVIFVAGGADAVGTIAGKPTDVAPSTVLAIALAADTLLPLGYASGMILFAFALCRVPQAEMTAPLIAIIVASGTTLDFLENGFAVSGTPVQALSIAKYGLLGLASMLIGATMQPTSTLGRGIRPVLVFVVPFSLALLLGVPASAATTALFAVSLLLSFGLFAAVCEKER